MKFIFGVFTGMVLGVFVLAGTVGGFISGLFLGWQLFYPDDEEPTTEEPDKVTYHRMGSEPVAGKPEEVTPT